MCTMSKDVPFKQFWFGKDIQTHKTIFWGGLFRESDSNFHINTHKHRECGWGVGGEGRARGCCSVNLMHAGWMENTGLAIYFSASFEFDYISTRGWCSGWRCRLTAGRLRVPFRPWSLANEAAISGSPRCFSCCRRRFSAVKK